MVSIYVVMKHSTIFTGIGDVDTRSFHLHSRDTSFPCLPGYLGDVDTRSFHRHGRDIGFPCLLGSSKQERPLVVNLYFYKNFTYSFKSTTDKQASSL